jgi:FdhD protein
MDELAVEEPLEIRVDNQPVSVTMRTPGHDDELAAGFLLGEGLITRREEVLKIAHHPRNNAKNVVGIFLAPDAPLDLKRLTRHFFVSSSCGLCGKASIAAVRRRFPAVKPKISVTAALLVQLPEKLRAQQQTFALTGGLHAAGLFDLAGRLIVAREDVGRHNAVDKVLGHALLNGWLPLDRHILFVSGRVSFEIVQKALAARVGVVAAVSAPTNLAVAFAQANGQTLIGFVREGRLNVYTHAKRVKFK